MILTALKDLESKSANEIAELLEVNGVKGYIESAILNPLAYWLERFAEEPIHYTAVTEAHLYVITETGQNFKFPLPESAQEFVRKYNAGLFPALEEIPWTPAIT